MAILLDPKAAYSSMFVYGGMGGDRTPHKYVIEVLFDDPAWIVYNPPPHKCDALCLSLSEAQLYTESGARNTLSRLLVGYPFWRCVAVQFTDQYRAWHASEESKRYGLGTSKNLLN